MTRHEHRPTSLCITSYKFAEPTNTFGIQTVGGLIKNQDLRLREESNGQAEALHHARRILLHALTRMFPKAYLLEYRTDPSFRHPRRKSTNLKMPSRADPRLKAKPIHMHANDRRWLGQPCEFFTKNASGTGSWMRKTDKTAHSRALSSAIRSKKTDDTSSVDLKGQAIYDNRRAVLFRVFIKLDCKIHTYFFS
ncbi:hypothetical protein B0H03_101459 [Rathayibacter iranicus NCPPB 2253 = VKM Ac-1602]|uniref:Uncharacterized protein n=1 Tax=Rathayibacter iranicus NCPPB 2253 = VKM Ac-1602 TaxID=1328868 RepID=A0ABX5LIG7_9MICO|nr:hypothetical protein B0H03_101459 [Rathayibacter iranicus NCPPB 2253 = VKM Ac-1602]